MMAGTAADVLNKRDTPLVPVEPRRGTVVFPQEGSTFRSIRAYAPRDELAASIEYFWIVRWDLGEPWVSTTIPQPRIHLTIEGDRVLVYGIDRRQFRREIDGIGVVLGVAFRPAMFRSFTDRSLKAMQDRVEPASAFFRNPFPAPTLVDPSDDDLVAYVDGILCAQQPVVDPVAVWCHNLVERIETDAEVTQVHQLAGIAGCGERSLQRRFTDYVGATPKWVIQRSRIMSLVAACNEGQAIEWAAMAHALGFADQAHLIRAFRGIVGVTPDRYLRRVQERMDG
ncbi:MAG: helix-turn-helix domain-containing protein [Thermomicrobiales bacterium]